MTLKKKIKVVLKECVAAWFVLFYTKFSKKGSILMYHSISQSDKFSTVIPEMFERQLQFLTRSGYSVISLEEMVRRINAKEELSGCVALTFDDGYLDFYDKAFPLLKKYNVPATLFVVTGFVGGLMHTKQGQSFTMINETQMKEMVDSGLVALMPHTKTHPRLSECSREEMVREIEDSRAYIEQSTARPAPFFAYPFGDYTMEAASYLRGNPAWHAAVTVAPGLADHGSDLFLLPRNSIDSEVGMWQFKMKVSDAIWAYNRIKK